MNELQKQELINLLAELNENVGDARGRDGEYLDQKILMIRDKVNALHVTRPSYHLTHDPVY